MTPRILVIRGGAIGDFILTLPAIQLIRENFPDVQIEILGYRHIVALAEARHYAVATRSIDYSGLAGFFVPGSELDSELVEYFCGFQQVVSYLYDPDGFFEGNLRRAGVKNLIVGSPRIDDSDHAARQLALPLQRLALYLEEPAARIHPTDEDRAEARSFLGERSEPFLAVHPGSGSEQKNWPLEKWSALGRRLVESGHARSLVAIGGEADSENIAFLRREWSRLPVLWAESMPLPHLAAVVESCSGFLGHDSGISHLAAAVGTPCILLFGPTDPEIWAPKNRDVKVVTANEKKLEQLTVDEVFEKVEHWRNKRT